MAVRFIIVMGVAGSGKTSVGQALASRLGWDFHDADDFHPPSNIAKMRAGIPLDDEDRTPWLAVLQDLIASCLARGRPGVLACSALKRSYRRTLLAGNSGVLFVYLKGSCDVIGSRLANRNDHYMKPGMLESQFEDLEEPPEALEMDASLTVDKIVENIAGTIGVPHRANGCS